MGRISDLVEEKGEFQKYAEEKEVIILSLIAPFRPKRVSPATKISPSLGYSDEVSVETIVEEVKSNVKEENRNLHLLVHSPGGGVSSSYMIARMLRDTFKDITSFVPYTAASGATLITIGSDQIVMGELSKLSPMDVRVQREGEEEPTSILSLLRGYTRLSKEYSTTPEEDIPYPDRHLINSVTLEEFEKFSSLLGDMYGHACEILSKTGYDEEKIEEISDRMIYSARHHNEIIRYTKAQDIGLNVEWYNNFEEEWRVMRRWLDEYKGIESATHHINYVIPESIRGENK